MDGHGGSDLFPAPAPSLWPRNQHDDFKAILMTPFPSAMKASPSPVQSDRLSALVGKTARGDDFR
jgi:hypothetical protein